MVFVCPAIAQDYAKDMEEIQIKYKSLTKLALKIKYVLHENHNANSRVISSEEGRYIKMNKKSLSSYDQITTLLTVDKAIMIDKKEKRMRIKKFQKQVETGAPDFLAQVNDYSKYIYKTTCLKTNKEHVILYNVELKSSKDNPISRYEIAIDKKNGFIVMLTLFYITKLEKNPDFNVAGTEVPRLDIIFSDINDSKLFSISEFEDSYYYSKQKGKAIPSLNFKGYDTKEII